MSFSRRQFLRYAAGSGLMLGLGGIQAIGRTRRGDLPGNNRATLAAGNPLRIPADHTGATIAASVVQQQIWPDTPTEVWTYGGSFPGPTFRVRKGDEFSVRLQNQLSEETTIHWHGMPVPAAVDGQPHHPVHPGATFDYAFTVNQRAGTYWYHPHPHMMVAEQVYRGMAGFFIVTDDEEQALPLPRGRYDIPLVIQDRRDEPNRAMTYAPDDNDLMHGMLGDFALVNGTPDAYLDVDRALYRFRILNGSNARVYKLALADGTPFHIIGTDGGLLDKPYEMTEVMLSPAERIEILVDFSKYQIGGSATLKSLEYEGGSGRQQGAEMTILRFDVARDGSGSTQIPATLSTIERYDPSQAVRERLFDFRSNFGSPPDHSINQKHFELSRIDLQVIPGELEVWTFINRSLIPHPIHVHGTQFQVIDRNGNADLAPNDRGWKDTVLIDPYLPVRVAVKFPSNLGVYLLHCHNLEHEDHGMMLNFEVTETLGVDNADGNIPAKMDLF